VNTNTHPLSALPPLSALHDSLLAQTILNACAEAKIDHTAHLRCCGVQVDAIDFGDHVFVALRHADWCVEGDVFADKHARTEKTDQHHLSATMPNYLEN
jgi:hypothetical protein